MNVDMWISNISLSIFCTITIHQSPHPASSIQCLVALFWLYLHKQALQGSLQDCNKTTTLRLKLVTSIIMYRLTMPRVKLVTSIITYT